MKLSVAHKIHFTWFLLPFIILFLKLPVSAVELVVPVGTLESVEMSANTLTFSQLANYGVICIDKTYSGGKEKKAVNDLSDYSNLAQLTDFFSNNFHESTLTNESYNSFSEMSLYNSTGQSVSIDDCYYWTYDNGYFSGHLLVDKNNLDLVYTDIDGTSPVLTTKFGGDTLTSSEMLEKCNDFSNDVKRNGYKYGIAPSLQNSSSISYYLWICGSAYDVQSDACSLFIANQYQPGIVVPTTTQNGQQITSWYANDTSVFQFQQWTGYNNSFNIQPANVELDGHLYHYLVSFGNFYNWSNLAVTDYNPGSHISTPYGCFAKNGLIYDTNLQDNVISSYCSALVDDTVSSPDLNDSYSYADIIGYGDYLDSISTTGNPLFDGTQAISESNFPISYPIEQTISIVYPFPFPIVQEEELESDPAITFPLDSSISIENIENFDEIPIISSLEKRFPFSIPWDIKKMFEILKARAEAPSFEIHFTFPVINYTWNFDLDLAPFDQTAELFRLCFLISFIIGLALFSYNHFFGT